MKKIICIFTACLSFFIFYLTFSTYSMKERSMIDLYNAIIEKSDLNVYVYQANLKNMDKSIEDLKTFAKEHHYIVMLGNMTMKGVTKIDSRYIYDPDEMISIPYTKNHRPFSLAKDGDVYLTTQESDRKSYDVFDFVDKRNNKDYQTIERWYPLSQYKDIVSDITRNNLFLFSKYPTAEHEDILNNSNIQQYIEEVVELSSVKLEETDVKTIIQIMSVCIIAICLLFICQMLKMRKEIILRKLMGFSTGRITNKLLWKQLLLYCVVYIITQCICFFLFIGMPRAVTFPFLFQLLMYFGIFLCFLMVSYAIVYVYVHKSRSFTSLKQHGQSKEFAWVNIGVKFLVLLMILPPFLTFLHQGWNAFTDYYYMASHRDQLRDQVYISSIDSRQTSNEDVLGHVELQFKFNTFLVEHGAILQDFESYESRKVLAEEDPTDTWANSFLPYIIVNDQYLKDYTLQDMKGKTISLTDIKKETLFLPEDMDFEGQEKSNYCNEDCDIVKVKTGNTYWNQHMHTEIRSMKDPIVVYQPNVVDAMGVQSYHLNIHDKKVKEALDQYLKESGLGKLITLQNTSNDYDIIIEMYKDDILFVFPLIITYIFVILVFIYQSAYIYFMQNKQKFAIKYMVGDYFIERHGDMLYHNLIVYVPMMLCLYFIFHVSVKETLLCILLAVAFEMAGSYLLIRVLERKRMIEILKGD